MIVDVTKLYKIVGEESLALRRVEEAVKWLLSPKAEGIGQKLLHDAHALHGKPINILVSEALPPAYITHDADMFAHSIFLHPTSIADLSFKGVNGATHAFSTERILAHELVHAGQRELVEEVAPIVKAIKRQSEPRPLPEEILALQNKLKDAQNPQERWKHFSTYIKARRKVDAKNFVDRFMDPVKESLLRPVKHDSPFTMSGLKAAVSIKNSPELLHLKETAGYAIDAHIAHAMEAADYETAIKHIGSVVDTIPASLQQKIADIYTRHHKKLTAYVETIENPAIAIENKVAALRGEPIRANYFDAQMEPKNLRQFLIGTFSDELGIELKPRTVSPTKTASSDASWVTSLGDKSGRKLGG